MSKNVSVGLGEDAGIFVSFLRERSEIRIPKSHIAVHLRYTNEHKSIYQIEPIIKYLKLLFQQYKKK